MAQWHKLNQRFLGSNESVFESVTLSDNHGAITDWRPSFTSKNRLRVSNPQTTFWSTWGRAPDNDTFAAQLVNGGTEYISNDAVDPTIFDPLNPGSNIITEKSVVLRVTNPGDKVIRQSTRVIPYIPGKEQFLTMAVRFDTPVAGIRRRIGLFDENNGAFFEDGGDNYYCVILKNGVETVRVPRELWNGDKLDGEGRSRITADPTKQQLVGIEYEWYGTGSVKFGYVIDGEFHTIHTVFNANATQGTWTRTPYLPIRFELEALPEYVGPANAYMWQASSSVIAEGGVESLGIVHNYVNNIDFGVTPPQIITTPANITNANTFYPIISLRINDLFLDSFASPQQIQVATADNTDLYYVLVKNPTLTGANFAIPTGQPQAVEIDESATAIDFDSGDIVFSGFSFGGNSAPINLPNTVGQFQIGRKFAAGTDFTNLTSDVFTIAVAAKGSNKQAFCSVTWIEQP